jgi:hypothetical protein
VTDDATADLTVVPRLGWRVQRRPRPGFAHVLGAAAGAFVVVAVVAFVVEATDDDPTVPGVVFNALLVAFALLVGFRMPGPIRSACVTAIVLGVPLVWFFALFGDGGGERSDTRGLYLLTLACYLVLYLLTWTRGRAIFLAGVLIFFASWISFEVAGDSNSGVIPFQSEISGTSDNGAFGFDTDSSDFVGDADDTTDETAAAALVVGLVFLGAGLVLDRRRYEGAATPFIAVGAIETIAGAVVLGGNQSVLLGGLLAVAAGTIVGLVAARGDRRRATTWIGVLTVFGGLVAVLVDIAPSSAAGVGGIAFGFAAVLGVLAWWLAPILGEPDDGDETTPPSPTPPGGDILTLPGEEAAA